MTHKALVQMVLVGIVAATVYSPALPISFTSDDFSSLAAVGFVDCESNLLYQRLTPGGLPRPLQDAYVCGMHRAFGLNPRPYHFVSIVTFAACAMLVYVLGRQVWQRHRVGLWSGIIFALYPRNHGTVAWMSSYHYLLVTLFSVMTISSFYSYLLSGELRHYLLSLAAFGLALLSNESAVVLLPILIMIQLLSGYESLSKTVRASTRRESYRKYIPFLAVLLTHLAVALCLSPAAHEDYSRTIAIPSVIKDLASYWTYSLIPLVRLRTLDADWLGASLALLTVGLSILLWLKTKWRCRISLLILAFGLLPFALFASFGNGDRYFCLASIGYSLLGGCFLARNIARPRKDILRSLVAACFILYSVSCLVLIQQRLGEWRIAGDEAAAIVEQMKSIHSSLPPSSRLYFIGLDVRYDSRPAVLSPGIAGASRLAYMEPTLQVYRSHDSELASLLGNYAGSHGEPIPGVYVFHFSAGQLQDKSDVAVELWPKMDSVHWLER